MGVVTICTCIGFGFTSAKCSSDISQFTITGYINGRPIYVGTFDNIIDVGNPLPSIECKVYWDGGQWVVQQTDPSFPEIVFFSIIDTDNICDLTNTDWQAGDFTNFPCTTLSLATQLIDCSSIPCNCYETTITESCDGVEIGYIDCSDNLVTFFGNKNETYSFCSKIAPLVSCRPPLTFLIKGECIDGQCSQPVTTTTTTFFPPQPVPNVPLEPTNECDVITIFPMGVECFTINPTNTETFNGVASLIITGGTPPYEILWETGSIGTTITNLGVGEYSATVTDSYGDFIINTTCELTAPVLPTTTTTSTTTLPSFGDLCAILTTQRDKTNSNTFIDFTFNGYYNGKPSWLAITQNLFMYWNTGTTSQWLVSGGTSNTIYNPNPATPPTSGWAFLGPTNNTISVVEGNCDDLPPLILTLSKNDSNCQENGSIIATASGGVPPYLYSLNGGITTQTSPIFQNLGPGNYSVSVIDSVNIIQTQNVTITQIGLNVNYVVTLNTTTTFNSKNFTVSVSPTLPAGVTVSYDLVYQTEFKVAPNPSVATQTVTPTINVNGSPITNPSPVTTNSTLFNPCDSGVFSITNRVYTWSNINMITTTTVSGSISDVVAPISVVACYSATKIRNLTINNLKISGCDCCSVLLQQTGGELQEISFA
jgi:hypothetical protein